MGLQSCIGSSAGYKFLYISIDGNIQISLYIVCVVFWEVGIFK